MSGSESSSPIPTRRLTRESRNEAIDRAQMRNRQNEPDGDDDYDYKRSIDIKSGSSNAFSNNPGLTTISQANTAIGYGRSNTALGYGPGQGNKAYGYSVTASYSSGSGQGNTMTGYSQSQVKTSPKTDRKGSRGLKNESSGSDSDNSDNSSETSDSYSYSDSIDNSNSSDSSDSSDSGSHSDHNSDDSNQDKKQNKKHKKKHSKKHSKKYDKKGKRHHKKTGNSLNALSTQQMPTDGSGNVDLNKLVSGSSGTGLLAGGVLPIQLNDGDDSTSSSDDGAPVSCTICTSALRNVVKLKCKHKFCYSCIKGHLMMKHRTCPYCQDNINPKFIKTILTEPGKVCKKIEKIDEAAKYYWLYDSRDSRGWWNFDNKSNSYLERDYQNWVSIPNHNSMAHRYTLQVCGNVMEIDFNIMAQINPITGVQRRISRVSAQDLRDLQANGQLKGIGGITQK